MKTNHLSILIACAGLLGSCAAIVPNELDNARQAYRLASVGPAARVAPAELYVAYQALFQAEQSFLENPDSYQTRDLAYVAQRKAQMAEATAFIAIDQKGQTQSNNDYQATQDEIVTKARQDLSQARAELVASECSNGATEQDLDQARTELAASERSGEMTAARLSAEQAARAAADQRAAVAQAALAKLVAATREEPRGVVITLSGSVLFASDQTTFLPEAQLRLDQVADVLLTTRERNLLVEGHTDSEGSESHNLDLSQGRANAVRDYLVQRGYQADRVQARGLGAGHPVADNRSAEGRASNRRVEIIIERDLHTSNP